MKFMHSDRVSEQIQENGIVNADLISGIGVGHSDVKLGATGVL